MMGSNGRSPAAQAMRRAIDLAIDGSSPFPAHAAFVDAGAPSAGLEIDRAVGEGFAVVLVAGDGSTRVLHSEGD